MSTAAASPEIDPFDLPPVHAIVLAKAGCAPTGIASSVFDWRGTPRLSQSAKRLQNHRLKSLPRQTHLYRRSP